jgi:2-dehydropantoate 2-reductase
VQVTRVAVVGGGAMGGVWAGAIAEVGHDVTIVDVAQVLVDAIGRSGMTVEEDGQRDIHATPAATTDPVEAGHQDVVFVFVKGPHTAAAASSLAPLVGPGTMVTSLQNGWGNADVLAQSVEPDQLVVGVTYESARIVDHGRVRRTGRGPTWLGPYREGASDAGAHAVATVMRSAGFEASVSPDVRTDVWKKLVHNASCLPVAALTGLHTSELVEPGLVCDLVDALASEAVAVARALGYDIDPRERIERIHAVLSASGMGVPSMLADVRGRRATEIGTINGAVVRAGRGAGVAVPLNEAMVSLVQGLERSWTRDPGP